MLATILAAGVSCAPSGVASAQQTPDPPGDAGAKPSSEPLPLPATPASTVHVLLRSGEGIPTGEYAGMSSLGVKLGTRNAAVGRIVPQLLISWDRVKDIEGLRADEQTLASGYLATGERVWRARRRLERGDLPAAESIAEGVFQELKSKPGPTTAVAAECLLRCRLRRGAHALAIEPWLATLSAREGPPTGETIYRSDWWSEANLAPAIDPATGLVPALPPIWLGWESVRAFGLSGDSSEGAGQGAIASRSASLMALFRASARFETGRDTEVPRVAAEDPAVSLVLAIVRSRLGDEETRQQARRVIEDRLRTATSPWMEAWCRSAIGRSLLQESALLERQRGILNLLELPARFRDTHPYLAGLALAESSLALSGMGEEAGAKVLRQELARDYPTHPVLAWPPIRSALVADGVALASGTADSAQPSAPGAPPAGTAPPPR